MAYGDWVIGGISLREFMLSADYSSYDQGKITLRGIAEKEDALDARDMIAQIEAIASKNISNTNLMNGSTNVQCSGPKVTITDGANTWQGAVHWPSFNEGHEAWRVIEWTIVLEVEFKRTANGSKLYKVPLDAYDNVDYHYGSDESDRGTNNDEIGYMNISESYPIRRVEIKGSAANLPAWVEVNGERLYWQTSFNGENKDTEILIWDLDIPANAVTIQSSTNISPWDAENNTGFWPIYILVVFA
jgi:hypothetical protein